MDKTCSEAFDIYCQYNAIHPHCEKRVVYLNQIINNMKTYTYIRQINFEAITIYAEKSIGKDKLTDEQQGRLVNSLSRIEMQTFNSNTEIMHKLINRLMIAIMDN